MLFLKIFSYVFFAYGLTEIMIYGRGPFGICEKIRGLAAKISDGMGQLFGCPMCFSTWVGLVSSLVDVLFIKTTSITPFNIIFSDYNLNIGTAVITVLLDMFFTSGVVWFLTRIEEYMENSQVTYEEDEYK